MWPSAERCTYLAAGLMAAMVETAATSGSSGDPQLRDLSPFSTRVHFKAASGRFGEGSNRQGSSGRDREIKVPLGTQVWVEDVLLGDVTEAEQRLLVARGGEGGRGNARFATSTRQAPRFAELGEAGESFWLVLSLKLMADVGLAGLPNAGKSMLLRRISNARPKVADYPFTTIEPLLGVVQLPGGDEVFTVADVPGLLEGASDGVGLGTQFLAHLERCHLLLHVVDVTGYYGDDPVDNFRTILTELDAHTPELSRKPQLVVLNKTDVMDDSEVHEWVETFRGEVARLRAEGHPAYSWSHVDQDEELGPAQLVWPVSAATGRGIKPMLQQVGRILGGLHTALAARDGLGVSPATGLPEEDRAAPGGRSPATEEDGVGHVVYRPVGRRLGRPFTVRRDGETFVVEGEQVRRMVARTDLGNDEALRYLGERLDRMGLNEALEELGASPGDEVDVEGFLFEYR